jgi:hypothetical protein
VCGSSIKNTAVNHELDHCLHILFYSICLRSEGDLRGFSKQTGKISLSDPTTPIEMTNTKAINVESMEKQRQKRKAKEPKRLKPTKAWKGTEKQRRKIDNPEVNHEKDAVFGRGADANRVRKLSVYRDLLRKNCEMYWKTPTKLKSEFVDAQVIRPIVSGGGRFMQTEKGSTRYKVLFPNGKDHGTIVKKIQQAFRDIKKADKVTTTAEAAAAEHASGPKKLPNRLVRVVSRDEDFGAVLKEAIKMTVTVETDLKAVEIEDLGETKNAAKPKLQEIGAPMLCGSGLRPACFLLSNLDDTPPIWYEEPTASICTPHMTHSADPALLQASPTSSLAPDSSLANLTDTVATTGNRTHHKAADAGDAVISLESLTKRGYKESIGRSSKAPRAWSEPSLADLFDDRSGMGFDDNNVWPTLEHIFADTNDGVLEGTDFLDDESAFESLDDESSFEAKPCEMMMFPRVFDANCFEEMTWDDVDIMEDDGDDNYAVGGMTIGCDF